jgi:hypothetical protein
MAAVLNSFRSRYLVGVLIAALCAAVLALAGCGGSDDSTDVDRIAINSLDYSPVGPGSNSLVTVNSTVTLTNAGTATSAITYAWTQVSGPTVTLSDPTASSVTFTAPVVTESTDIVLNLTVTLHSVTDSKTVTITISP